MERDRGVSTRGIEVHSAAVGDKDGVVTFHRMVGPEGDQDRFRALGSTRSRVRPVRIGGPVQPDLPVTAERVPMVRLDSILTDAGDSVALWIDTEGGAFEVLEGAASCLARTTLIHVEVETIEFWTGQRTEASRSLRADPGNCSGT